MSPLGERKEIYSSRIEEEEEEEEEKTRKRQQSY